MKINSYSVYKFLLFLLVLLPIYQDSPLSLYFGAAGYTLLMPLVYIFILIYVFFNGKIPKNRFLYELVKLGIWIVIISYAAIIIWVMMGNSLTVVSEFLPYKALKVCLQYFAYPAYIMLIIIICRKIGAKFIGKYSFVALIVITLICLCELRDSPYAFQNLHFAAEFPYWRVRLLSLESSWTAMTIYVYTFISLYWTIVVDRKMINKVIVIVCAVILLSATGSRALMLTVAITAVLYLFFGMKKLSRKVIMYFFVAIAAIILFTQLILPQIIDGFTRDIEDYTSIATRVYTSLIGLGIGICFPCGVGGAVYLGVLQQALSKYLYVFSKLPIELNISEIVSLATRTTDQALTVKSGLFHMNMYWGILGTIYLLRNFVRLSKSLRNTCIPKIEVLLAAFWCTVVLITASSNFSFEFWLLYAFMLCLYETHNKEEIADEE